jgi:FKBP-type peptidyl-prolyl cis-trans isomerase
MQRLEILMIGFMVVSGVCAAQAANENPPAPAPPPQLSDSAKISYSMGVQIGQSLKRRQDFDLDRASLVQGIQDVLEGKPPLLSGEEMRLIMDEFRKTMVAKQQERMKKEREEGLNEQRAFLEENGKKEGVVTLPSGLQYKVLAEGTGRVPTATDRVRIHYRGTFVNGQEFLSTYAANKPQEVQVNKDLPGRAEALQLMKEGAKWQVFVPAALAYGEQGWRGIGANRMLIFEVELLEILPKEPAPAPATPPPPAQGASAPAP